MNISKQINDYLYELPDWIGPDSGWGYSQDDALIITSHDSMTSIRNEYLFAEFRSQIEVMEVMKQHYGGFERCRQTLKAIGNSHYDVIEFKVYYFSEEDWNFLKNDFESHNEYKNDEAGLEAHNHLRAERLKYYISQCWFNIDSFFGKG